MAQNIAGFNPVYKWNYTVPNIVYIIVWFHQIILKRIQYYIKVKTILMLSTNTFSNT